MKTRTLVLLVPLLTSCGVAALNNRHASVDAAVASADVPEPSLDGAVDAAVGSADLPEPSLDGAVDEAVDSTDAPEPSLDGAVDEAVDSTDILEPSYDAFVDGLAGTWDAHDERDWGVDAKDWDGYPAGSGCRFRDTPGWAIITKIASSPSAGRECNAVVTFNFIAGPAMDAGMPVDASAHDTGRGILIDPPENPPCSYLEANGIVVGATLPAIRQDEFAGACPTPVYVFPGIEYSLYTGL